MTLRLADAGDIDFLMQTERLPGYEVFIGRSTAEQHAARMASPTEATLIFEEAGARAAFAMLQRLDDPNGNIYLDRFAVARQGQGVGARAVAALQDWVFARPAAHRLFLHYSVANVRGRRLYATAGFQDEGVERQVYLLPGGDRIDSRRVSILRPEWEGLRRRAP